MKGFRFSHNGGIALLIILGAPFQENDTNIRIPDPDFLVI